MHQVKQLKTEAMQHATNINGRELSRSPSRILYIYTYTSAKAIKFAVLH